MKILSVLSSLFLTSVVFANPVFECKKNAEGNILSMTVTEEKGGRLVANFEGSTLEGPQEVIFIGYTKEGALSDELVKYVLRELKAKAIVEKIATVVSYETGDYSDSGAAIVGYEFYDSSGNSILKAMLFGWAGPLKCDQK